MGKGDVGFSTLVIAHDSGQHPKMQLLDAEMILGVCCQFGNSCVTVPQDFDPCLAFCHV